MLNDKAILVLGAGELGMAVLRNLARRAGRETGVSIAALLRPSAIASEDMAKQKDLAELRALGIEFVEGDLTRQPSGELAAIFSRYRCLVHRVRRRSGCTAENRPSRAGGRNQALFPMAVRCGLRHHRQRQRAGAF